MPSSSAPIRREYPATSAARIAVRRRVEAIVFGLAALSSHLEINPNPRHPHFLFFADENRFCGYPKPAKPEPNRRAKTRLVLGRAGNFG